MITDTPMLRVETKNKMTDNDLIIETVEEVREDVNLILYEQFNFGIDELKISNQVCSAVKQMFINNKK